MVTDIWQLLGYVVFNLMLMSLVLVMVSIGLWLAGRVKAAAGFDPSVLQNPFESLLRRNVMIFLILLGLSVVTCIGLVITS